MKLRLLPAAILAYCLLAALAAAAGCGQRSTEDEGFSAPQEGDFATEGPRRSKTEPRRERPRVPPEVLAAMGHADAGADAAATDGGISSEAGTPGGDAAVKSAAPPELSPEARALAKAVTEAAEQTAEDYCEQSLNALKGLARAANRAVPRRADYLQVCGELPREMQRCLIPGYRVENREKCNRSRDAVEPQLLERFRKVVEVAARR